MKAFLAAVGGATASVAFPAYSEPAKRPPLTVYASEKTMDALSLIDGSLSRLSSKTGNLIVFTGEDLFPGNERKKIQAKPPQTRTAWEAQQKFYTSRLREFFAKAGDGHPAGFDVFNQKYSRELGPFAESAAQGNFMAAKHPDPSIDVCLIAAPDPTMDALLILSQMSGLNLSHLKIGNASPSHYYWAIAMEHEGDHCDANLFFQGKNQIEDSLFELRSEIKADRTALASERGQRPSDPLSETALTHMAHARAIGTLRNFEKKTYRVRPMHHALPLDYQGQAIDEKDMMLAGMIAAYMSHTLIGLSLANPEGVESGDPAVQAFFSEVRNSQSFTTKQAVAHARRNPLRLGEVVAGMHPEMQYATMAYLDERLSSIFEDKGRKGPLTPVEFATAQIIKNFRTGVEAIAQPLAEHPLADYQRLRLIQIPSPLFRETVAILDDLPTFSREVISGRKDTLEKLFHTTSAQPPSPAPRH